MIKYRVIFKTGSYVGQDGTEKGTWAQAGVVTEKDGKLSLKLDSIPLNSDGWFVLAPPREEY